MTLAVERDVKQQINLNLRHAPLISRLKKKDSADWMSDAYRHAKSIRRQFERTWHRAKNPLNRSRLHHHNALVNNDKSDYSNKLISDNSHDSRNLWRELHKTLNRLSDATLPSHESEKSLADQFASFFRTNSRKLEILSLPLELKMRFTLHQILQKLLSLDKFLKLLLVK